MGTNTMYFQLSLRWGISGAAIPLKCRPPEATEDSVLYGIMLLHLTCL